MSSSELRFDVKKVDVKKAEEYLMINKEFHSIGSNDSGEIEYDAYNNKIFLSPSGSYSYASHLSKPVLSPKLIALAELVLENTNLLCQLDYLVRKTPIEETRDVEIKLLVQNLIYRSSHEENEETSSSADTICMYDDIPLSTLGLIAVSKRHFTIFSTHHTAVICSVFVDLCHKVGLNDYVYLIFVSNISKRILEKKESFFSEELRSGCVGIVTERADIDSAIDTFLYATRRFPWNIKTIYVQESVLDQFKKRIEWKSEEPSSDVNETIMKSCSSVRVYEDKIYLFEFAGNIKKISKNSIIIEAYRTNKEIISFMSGIKTLGVSLWSNDVAQSNEIAFNIKANIVWINDFCRFDGPPAASQAFYSSIVHYKDKLDALKRETEEILKKRTTWKKFDEIDRYLKVWKATRTIQSHIESSNRDIVLKFSNNSTTSIGNKICTVLRIPVLLYVRIKSLEDLLKHMNFILNGGSVYFLIGNSSERDIIMKYCKELQSCGAPVAFVTYVDGFVSRGRYDTKVIWSSIETIFAN